MGAGQDGGVGVDEEEEDHGDDHEVGIDTEEDAAVVPAPARAHAADVVDQADGGGERGEDEEGVGVVLGEVGEDERCGEAGEDEDAATEQRASARVEEGRLQCG